MTHINNNLNERLSNKEAYYYKLIREKSTKLFDFASLVNAEAALENPYIWNQV